MFLDEIQKGQHLGGCIWKRKTVDFQDKLIRRSPPGGVDSLPQQGDMIGAELTKLWDYPSSLSMVIMEGSRQLQDVFLQCGCMNMNPVLASGVSSIDFGEDFAAEELMEFTYGDNWR